ncbi:MAG: response regulator, partial [Alphaproteobacteria bacterium]
TTVTLLLPAAEAHAEARDDADVGTADPHIGRENILVVEDDDLVRAHVENKLESLGYAVVAAASGREALAILEERRDIDLLFTDIVMPGGMNGRELGEIAARRWPGLRVLYTSGYSGDLLSRDGRLIEGVQLLTKPYTKHELSTKIRQALDELA